MYIDHQINDVWETHIVEGSYYYYTFRCIHGAAIVEPNDNSWFWQVDKPDEGMIWDDATYEVEELDGWWGRTETEEEAKHAVLKALGIQL